MPKCLLCLKEDDQLSMTKVSHMLPNCLSQHLYGKRDNETVESLDVKNGRDTFFGRNVVQDIDFRVRQPIHTGNNIFCHECDTQKLGQLLESKVCADLIKQINDSLNNQQKNNHVKSAELKLQFRNFSKYDLRVFLISIIWRQSLLQNSFGNSILSNDVMENMRQIIHQYLYENKKVHEQIFPIAVISPNKIQSITDPNSDNPYCYITNPELFFLGIFGVFIQLPGQFNITTKEIPFSVLKLVKSKNLKILPLKILFLEHDCWKNLVSIVGVNLFEQKKRNSENTLLQNSDIPPFLIKPLLEKELSDQIQSNPKLDVWNALDASTQKLSN